LNLQDQSQNDVVSEDVVVELPVDVVTTTSGDVVDMPIVAES
jgi:hypothetical protein